jgi:hypothetical protein
MPAAVSPDYDHSVFINCPYDEEYLDLLHAITFTIRWAGFIPRAALEEDDAGTARLERIYRIIDECRYGIHDVSRIEARGPDGLPRFNMPFECGIFFGAKRFGSGRHRRKRLLVLESHQHVTQKTLSDIAGNDPKPHDRSPETAIDRVWSFLAGKDGARRLPGPQHVKDLYAEFRRDMPRLAEELRHSQIDFLKLEQWKVFVIVVDEFLAKRGRTHAAAPEGNAAA